MQGGAPQQGAPQPDSGGMQVVQQIQQKVQQLDSWAGEMTSLVGQLDQSLLTYMQEFGSMAKKLLEKLMGSIQDKAQRSGAARGSPVVPQQPPASPAQGPPNPNAM
jgi:hypothetical protein